jgi:ribonucleoside-diphosphate reductase alpha chain
MWRHKFYEAMASLKFIPNTPTLVNAGKPNGQLAACFVLPVEDNIPGIYGTLSAAAQIQTSGGGTGFSGARIRCKGSAIGSTGKISDGSNVFLSLFNDSSYKVLRQGAARKGANMWVLPIWHADIEEFIDAKLKDGDLSEFNISVGITDAFMEAVSHDAPWALLDPKDMSVVKTVGAGYLLNKIIENAWKNGEPGLLFLDAANRANPTPALGAFEATNPCGEQWLLPWEACTLGHINLAKMYKDVPSNTWSAKIDWAGIDDMARLAVRFLDDVIEVNHYPLPQIEEMHKKGNRKIGVGVMGFADLLIKLGIPYDTNEAREVAEAIAKQISDITDKASVGLAKERGFFPNYEKSSMQGVFGMEGIRNACRRTVAPTGSTSIIAGSVGGGIEPVFGLVIVRNQAGMKMYEVNPTFDEWLKRHCAATRRTDPSYYADVIAHVAERGTLRGAPGITDEMVELFKQANDIAPRDHILMQAAWQKYVDNSISKTINMPKTATREDVREAYTLAFSTGCKGVTVYRDGSRDGQVLNMVAAAPTEKVAAPVVEDERNVERDHVTHGTARKIPTGCGNSFIFIGRGRDGSIDDIVGKLGKSGGCASAWWEALGRLSSIALRHGVSAEEIRKQLTGISCHLPTMYYNSPLAKPGEKPPTITSCADALATALLEVQMEKPVKIESPKIESPKPTTDMAKLMDAPYNIELQLQSQIREAVSVVYNKKHMGSCPDCGSSQLDHGSGCLSCRSCGFSMC